MHTIKIIRKECGTEHDGNTNASGGESDSDSSERPEWCEKSRHAASRCVGKHKTILQLQDEILVKNQESSEKLSMHRELTWKTGLKLKL